MASKSLGGAVELQETELTQITGGGGTAKQIIDSIHRAPAVKLVLTAVNETETQKAALKRKT